MTTITTPESPVALVIDTGGDTPGLVHDLLDAGYRVVLTGPRAGKLTRALHEQSPQRVYAIAANMTDPWQSQQVRARVLARFGRIDEVISAA
jgi:NAD(P)-dependent dehydrogenase (short-subunit alcohol dehydrogenase family)